MLIRFVCSLGIIISISLKCTAGEEKKDEDLIQGSWTVVSLEIEGKVNKGPFKGGTWVFNDKEVAILDRDKVLAKGTFVLDSKKKQRTVELTGIDEQKDKTFYGIYQIEKDTLTLCYGDDLPKEFSGAGKAGLLKFEREKSK
jgi:uncharacterized protein (TIGR03067 family)